MSGSESRFDRLAHGSSGRETPQDYHDVAVVGMVL